MIIEVKQELLDLIKQIETRELAEQDDLNFSWSYYEDGQGASGEAWAYRPHSEYQIYVSKNGIPSVQRRFLDKYSNDNWETDPLDSDYEEEEIN